MEPDRAALKDEARERLARALFEAMEKLDPSQETLAWDGLPSGEKDFYRACVIRLESERGPWSRLLAPMGD